jgi:ATP-dependent Clp protease adaptor protein ClpS
VDGGGTTTLEPDVLVEERTHVPPPWRVVLHDDPVTTMEFVVELLVGLFGKPPVEAVRLMLEVHHGGAATVAVCAQERAELYVEQVVSLSRPRGFPLAATAEPA